jgi:threonine dehydratase
MRTPTPLERAPATLAQGRDLWLKREDGHEIGSFKWRGALPVVRRLAAGGASAVVTASTGNHGAAVSWACRELGVQAVVYAPPRASTTKLSLLEELGADVRLAGRDFDEAKDEALRFATAAGLPYFEDGAEPLQYEAYEEIGRELLRQAPAEPRAVVIPIGNGALAGGVGAAVARTAPGAVRVGVVAKAMPVMADSFEAGAPVAPRGGETIADGLAVRVAIPLAVERLRGSVDRIVPVSERALADTVASCAASGVRVEASAAAAIAALPEIDVDGLIVAVITGRNIDEELLERARSDPDSFPA